MTKENTKYLINGEKGKWEVVIGLEVHAQVTSNSKLFLNGWFQSFLWIFNGH